MMTGYFNDVAAILRFSETESSEFWPLAGMFAWCLKQAGIRIYRHDLALDGDSMAFETDHGRIRITSKARQGGSWTLTIGASARLEGSREVARQICYQLSQRVMARHQVENVHWRPTRQNFAPKNFKWSGLRDMPIQVNQTMRRAGFVAQTSPA